MLMGGALFWANLQRRRSHPAACLELACAESAFTIMHGIAHLLLGHVLTKDTLAAIQATGVGGNLIYFVFFFAFLGLGPFLGFQNGLDLRVCLVAHLVTVASLMAYIPPEFAFGAVQIVLTSWYCIPRVMFLGYAKPEAISQRVDDGWALISVGFFVLMPVIFIELLACDAFMLPLGGHLLYDISVLVLSVMYSATIWRQCDGTAAKSAGKSAV